MQVVVLAGGFGSRLKEVISDRPKILAPIKGKPFIDYLFYLFKKRGFTEIILSLGYLSGFVKEYVNQRSLYNLSVIYSLEDRPLGTGGALKKAERYLRENFFVVNGDTYLDIDYQRIFRKHQKKKAWGTIVLAPNDYSQGWGWTSLGKKSKVIEFSLERNKRVKYVNAGACVFNRKVFSFLEADYRSSLEKDLFPLLAKRGAFYGTKVRTPFLDIGNKEGYQRAKEVLRR